MKKVEKSFYLALFLGTVITFPFSSTSYAGPERGVKCPSGYTAHFASNKVLRCRKTSTQYANTLCPDIPFNIYKVRRGADKCATADVVNLPVTGPVPTGLSSKLRGVKCMALPGTTGWKLETDKVRSGGGKKYKDRCKRTKSNYTWPSRR